MRAAPLALALLAATSLLPAGGAADHAAFYQQRACPAQGAFSVSVRACEMDLYTEVDGAGCTVDPCSLTLTASAAVRGLPTPKEVSVTLAGASLCSGASTLGTAACEATQALVVDAGCILLPVTATGTASAPSGTSLRDSVQVVHEYRACRVATGLDVALASAR